MDVHQGPFIVIPLELQLQTGVDVADPDIVLIPFHIPFPAVLIGPQAALEIHPHRIFGHAPLHGDFQDYIIQKNRLIAAQFHLVFNPSIKLHARLALQPQRGRLVGKTPLHRSIRLSGKHQLLRAPIHWAVIPVHLERHGTIQHFPGRTVQSGHRGRKIALDGAEKPIRLNRHAPAKAAERIPLLGHGDKRLDDFIILGDLRVQPSQSRVPPRLTVATIHRDGIIDHQREPNLLLALVFRTNGDHARIGVRRRRFRNIYGNPHRLDPATFNGYFFHDLSALPIFAAEMDGFKTGVRYQRIFLPL
ncbi:MAG: hypothetical protein BWY83_00967 [bacterium ADurb.Bin478]|nr:MAG: hypothetical protein BWY83_00967 [bacterium ADurb.Bin478]